MTDEMRIQQQTSSTPYLLGGLGVGAAGGYGLSKIDSIKNWASDPATLERLKEIGEKPDTVELSTKQKATLDSLKAKLEELKAAEAELEAAGKATLDPKATERVNYEKAQAELKAEMERLVEQQKAILEKGNTTTAFAKGGIKPFGEIPATELPTTHAFGKQKGKPFKGNELENLYNQLTGDLTKAENVLDNKLKTGLRLNKGIIRGNIELAFARTETELTGKTPEQIAEYFAEKEVTTGVWPMKKTAYSKQYQRVFDIAKSYYPEVTTLTDEQLISIGKEVNATEVAPKGFTKKAISVKDAKGWTQTKFYLIEDAAADNLLNQEKQRIATLRTQAADQMFGEAQRAYTIKANERGLAEKVAKSFPVEDVVEKTGLYNKATGNLDMTKLIAEGNGTIAHGTSTGYVADAAKLREAISRGSTTMPSGLNGNYAGAKDLKEALLQAEKRQQIFKSYKKQSEAIAKEFKGCLENNAIIQEYNQKIANEIASDAAVQKAKSRLAEQFPTLFSETSATKLTQDEIATQAKAWAEKNINKSYQDAVDSTKKLFDEAVAKSGAVDEAAKTAMQGKVDKCKGELEKMGKEFCSTSKGKLALVIGGTAVAGALLAMALKPKNN